MAQSSTERSTEFRKRMKAKGYVMHSVWVHKSNVESIKVISILLISSPSAPLALSLSRLIRLDTPLSLL